MTRLHDPQSAPRQENPRVDPPCAALGSRAARHHGEQGFVLMFVFFMAAAVAITLALSMPQAAMQAQRVKEERLIYRGKEYARAIELYFRKFKKYPQEIKDLEESDRIRFLRRRYKDPLTGEDEWRLIHMGQDGRFKDSLVYDLADEEEGGEDPYGGDRGTNNPFTWNAPPIGTPPSPADQPGFQAADGRFRGAERARVARESAAPAIPGEGGAPVDPDDPNAQAAAGQPGAGAYPGYSRTLPSQIPDPNNPASMNPAANQPATVPGQPGYGQQAYPQTPAYAAGNPYGSSSSRRRSGRQNRGGIGGAVGFGQAGRQGVPTGAGAPMGIGPQGGAAAGDIIRRILTTPRPGGLAGLRRGSQAENQQAAFGGGIAGVASKVEDRGVKVYEGRELYNEWEFVYDYRQDQSMGAGGEMAGQQQEGDRINPNQPGLAPGGALAVTPGVPVGSPGYPQGVPQVPGVPGYPGPPTGVAGQNPGFPGGNQPQPGDPGFPQGQPDPYAQPGQADPYADPNQPVDQYGQPIDPNTQPDPNQPYSQPGLPGVTGGQPQYPTPGSVAPRGQQQPILGIPVTQPKDTRTNRRRR